MARSEPSAFNGLFAGICRSAHRHCRPLTSQRFVRLGLKCLNLVLSQCTLEHQIGRIEVLWLNAEPSDRPSLMRQASQLCSSVSLKTHGFSAIAVVKLDRRTGMCNHLRYATGLKAAHPVRWQHRGPPLGWRSLNNKHGSGWANLLGSIILSGGYQR